MNPLPLNAPAREVARLQSINIDLDEQIRVLQGAKSENLDTIHLLEGIAQWGPSGEYSVPEPEVEPEIDVMPGEGDTDG